MKYKMKIKQIIVALIGNCVLGAGVAMGSQALLGTDPSVSFSQAAAPIVGVTIGQMITITNITLLAITFFVKRKNIGLSTLIVVLLNQYPVDFVTGLITHSDSLVINVLWILAGIIFVAIGCDILIASNLGMGIYDAFVFGIADRLNKKFVIVRYAIDSIFLLLTIILHGYIGIGTILPYILTGPIIAYTKPIIEKMIKFD